MSARAWHCPGLCLYGEAKYSPQRIIAARLGSAFHAIWKRLFPQLSVLAIHEKEKGRAAGGRENGRACRRSGGALRVCDGYALTEVVEP